MLEIKYTQKALSDLEEVLAYVAEHSPGSAIKQIRFLKEKIEGLAHTPLMGVHASSKGLATDCRILIASDYLIFYQLCSTQELLILRVLHGKRDYCRIFNQELQNRE
ncbi:type II toxin-antitoxin system RelE/ParE family toxin [Desulfurispira natronophila]|uniref:Addiction module RelE/StbE family toxin n=1 Tax=Desulfurispira natronophila TaxID=682562 RepID=A0A7W8DHZ1_9BACT|nr:type II toxin-antitoxin system RelE/ParE family toxin [Desulfurispira natronophila]MBB5022862.1 addiction module RelE/StbE family toxin [Desulfurispira natronophila]